MPHESGQPLELAVVLPTLNERANIDAILHRLSSALAGIRYEVVVVDDDSPDGSAAFTRQIAVRNPFVRVVQRINRRGLSSACIEGMLATSAPYIAVMDADLQHDEAALAPMLAKIKAEDLDLVVATRNVEGGSMGDFAPSRVRLSNLGKKLSAAVSHCRISDPMSGFFVLDRRFLDEVAHNLSGVGFKILLDLLASSRRPVRLGEVPYCFRPRIQGESKLDILVGMEYLQLLLDKLIGGILPTRYVIFGLVGTVGAFVHLSLLAVLLLGVRLQFMLAQALTTSAVMTLNFFLNNVLTYRDKRLHGRHLATGLLSFYAACSLGAVINLRVAVFGVANGVPWYIAGLAGILISSVWNYAVTGILTWRRSRTPIAEVPRKRDGARSLL